jgi:hypothetical protein
MIQQGASLPLCTKLLRFLSSRILAVRSIVVAASSLTSYLLTNPECGVLVIFT